MSRLRWALTGLLLWSSVACGEQASEPAPSARGEASARPKVAVLGVDGATFKVIRPMIAEGRLPNLAALMERGIGVPLKKPSRYNASPVLWNTIVTGTLPETHGILNFGKVEDGKLSVFASSDRKVPALWNLVNARDRSAGVMAVWNTWPAEKVDGYVVSDRFGHSLYKQNYAARGFDEEWGITHPEALTEELRGYVRDPQSIRREEVESLGEFSDAEWAALLEGARDGGTSTGNGLVSLKFGWISQETVAAASLHMLREREQPDFFMAFLELPDRVSHHFWHAYAPGAVRGGAERVEAEWRQRWADVLPAAYDRTDWWIGQLVAELDPDTTVIVVSDHGFQSSQLPGGTLADLTRVGNSGEHHDEGILIAAGPAIQAGARGRATILDVAPLVLAAMGLAPSEQFAGRLNENFLAPDFVEAFPLREPIDDAGALDGRAGALPAGVDPSELDAEYLRQLSQLGYTDSAGKVLADTVDDEDG